MLREARKFLLNVSVFGYDNILSLPSPYFDKQPLEMYLAAIVLAGYYLHPKEHVMILVKKMNQLFPGRLEGTTSPNKIIENSLDRFVYNVRLGTATDIIYTDKEITAVVNDILRYRLNPPQ